MESGSDPRPRPFRAPAPRPLGRRRHRARSPGDERDVAGRLHRRRERPAVVAAREPPVMRQLHERRPREHEPARERRGDAEPALPATAGPIATNTFAQGTVRRAGQNHRSAAFCKQVAFIPVYRDEQDLQVLVGFTDGTELQLVSMRIPSHLQYSIIPQKVSRKL